MSEKINIRIVGKPGLYTNAELIGRNGQKVVTHSGKDLARWNPPPVLASTVKPRQFWWMGSQQDPYIENMPSHVERTIVYPFGRTDAARRAAKFPKSWVYKDAYAIYNPLHPSHSGTDHYAKNKQYTLKSLDGRETFIDWGAVNGVYPQYAADIRIPEWRAKWIQEVRPTAEFYGGIFMDDCNFTPQTAGPFAAGVTNVAWSAAMAQFVFEIKQAMPNIELLINTWYFRAGGLGNIDVRNALAAANGSFLEFGFNDAGLTVGGGQFGFDTLVAWTEFCHLNKTFVAIANAGGGNPDYHWATYRLVQAEGDFCTDKGNLPFVDSFGNPLENAKPMGGGIWERRFEKGLLRVNSSTRNWAFV